MTTSLAVNSEFKPFVYTDCECSVPKATEPRMPSAQNAPKSKRDRPHLTIKPIP
ncbi:hypothetical protein FF011L_53330 [Roseimaritima multifibrata]|uniref:Uncharacterized protein n=1 Tax=Roseimaritima multifibrata TaxID=1930274 RepID=A0A517MNR9_9BACT|nr:hypothetical protein [Roseimaritima multifibrata]QDS96521.1 hypothetical protein FF011L_53330 [Roseimaritima multifibrata]